MPKISILIPVYNVESYLPECLDSIINQTEKDIEIICVDDASTDASLRILEKYASLDKRIIIFRHMENKGLCQTRKDAVKISSGEYIMFLDSDDYLSLNACEELYTAIENANVDFLQFGARILTNENVSEELFLWTTNFMEAETTRIEDDELLKACFIDHKFNCNLVNKIWKADICKKAYDKILEGHYVSAEDRYAVFLLCYYAKSYFGVKDKYYHYRLGVGITGGDHLDYKRFESRCKGSIIANIIKTFLEEEHMDIIFKNEYEAFRNDILWDCVDCWHNKLDKNSWTTGYELLIQYWGVELVVGAIGMRYFEEQNDILKRSRKKRVYHVAIYYRHIGYNAMDDVLKHYIAHAEYKEETVYLLTDQDTLEKGDTYMNRPLFHMWPATLANWDEYQKRCNDFYCLLIDNHIQKVYYLSPTSHVRGLDELTVKSAGIEFALCMDEYAVDIKNKLEQTVSLYIDEKEQLYNEINELKKALDSSPWNRLFQKITSNFKEN